MTQQAHKADSKFLSITQKQPHRLDNQCLQDEGNQKKSSMVNGEQASFANRLLKTPYASQDKFVAKPQSLYIEYSDQVNKWLRQRIIAHKHRSILLKKLEQTTHQRRYDE